MTHRSVDGAGVVALQKQELVPFHGKVRRPSRVVAGLKGGGVVGDDGVIDLPEPRGLSSNVTRCITMCFDVAEPGLVTLSVTYQVSHAQWTPSYGA